MKRIFMFFIGAVMLAGCSGAEVSAIRTETKYFKQPHEDLTVVVEDEDMPEEFKIADIKFRNKGSLRQLAFRIINPDDNIVEFEYLVKWEDKDEFPVTSGTVWEPISLTGGMQKNISVIAKSPKAKRAILHIRPVGEK